MNYLDYWCEAMRDPTVEDRQVKVRYNPFDVSEGFVYIDGRWRKCDCPYFENATGASHILVGTYEMRPFRKANAQLACRSVDVHFPAMMPPSILTLRRSKVSCGPCSGNCRSSKNLR